MTIPADHPLGATVDPVTVGSAARSSSEARILDRGYRRYTGPQRGTRGAITTLALNTAQRALGLRRSFWSKIFPLLAIFIAYVPAIVFVGFVAPEVLCTDRRNGMLGLYLASPLNRNTYLLAKALAVTLILALVTVGPPLLYLVGLTLNDRGPDGFGGFLQILAKVLVAGIAVAAMQVALSFAVAATTTRRAAASAAIILILLASAILTNTLVNAADLTSNLLLLDLLFLPFEVVFRIFGEGHVDSSWRRISTPVVYGAYIAWTVAFATFVWYRYRRLQITR